MSDTHIKQYERLVLSMIDKITIEQLIAMQLRDETCEALSDKLQIACARLIIDTNMMKQAKKSADILSASIDPADMLWNNNIPALRDYYSRLDSFEYSALKTIITIILMSKAFKVKDFKSSIETILKML